MVAEYGPQVNPRFGTKTFRNGIDIEASEGSNITAVFPGHVVYTGWFRGYGNLIIVDHGGEYYTLYAHVADIQVTEGDDVKQGQMIGTVGDTGSLQGPRLYFEVRHAGQAAGSHSVAAGHAARARCSRRRAERIDERRYTRRSTRCGPSGT